jgi:hypothetical protein
MFVVMILLVRLAWRATDGSSWKQISSSGIWCELVDILACVYMAAYVLSLQPVAS